MIEQEERQKERKKEGKKEREPRAILDGDQRRVQFQY